MWHGNHDIAGFHTGAHQRETQRIRSTAHADAILCTAQFREVVLELLHHRPANKSGGTECTLENIRQLLLQLDMRSSKIQEWYAIFGAHFCAPISIVTLVSMNLLRRAGFPTTMAFAGTSLVTTLPAPTIAFSPIVTFARIVAPEPIEAPFLTSVGSTFQSLSVCNSPSGAVARGWVSLVNVTPWPTKTSSSIVTPSQMNV